jgi:iron complex transport system ATP-binding protein
MLEAREVALRRGGRRVLESVSLAIRPGAVLALCGPNGAGKSSLLALLAGDLRPDAGAVTLDGTPLASIGAEALARLRAVLEQSPSLSAPFLVRDLVALGLGTVPISPGEAEAVIDRAMRAAGVAPFADRAADRLSGGERARAHLARALAQIEAGRRGGGGRYLLLDEPTASLDLAHQVAVMRAARAAAAEGAGVLAVLHDLNLAAAFADRVVLLDRGRVAAEGAPADVLDAARLSAVYGAPVAVRRTPSGSLSVAPDFDAIAPNLAAE